MVFNCKVAVCLPFSASFWSLKSLLLFLDARSIFLMLLFFLSPFSFLLELAFKFLIWMFLVSFNWIVRYIFHYTRIWPFFEIPLFDIRIWCNLLIWWHQTWTQYHHVRSYSSLTLFLGIKRLFDLLSTSQCFKIVNEMEYIHATT